MESRGKLQRIQAFDYPTRLMRISPNAGIIPEQAKALRLLEPTPVINQKKSRSLTGRKTDEIVAKRRLTAIRNYA